MNYQFKIYCTINFRINTKYTKISTIRKWPAKRYLLATRIKKEQQSIVNFSIPESSHLWTSTSCVIIAHAHSVPHVLISPFVRSALILVSHNAYHIHNSFLWNNARLRIYFLQTICLVIHLELLHWLLLSMKINSVPITLFFCTLLLNLHLFRNITLCEAN